MQHKLYDQIANRQFDVIVVPGIQFEASGWDRVMKGRVYWAKFLYDKGIAKNIMFSGGAVYTAYYEARIMKLYAEALGIPAEHIFTETKAEHSTENIYYSYKLAKKLGFKTIALATDPFQSKQLHRFIRKRIDNDVPVIPFVVDTLRVIELTMTDPPISYREAGKENFISIKKRQGLFKRLRGTGGRNIDTSAYN